MLIISALSNSLISSSVQCPRYLPILSSETEKICSHIAMLVYLALFINTYYTGKLINLGWGTQMKDLIPSLMVSVFMGIGIYLIDLALSNDYAKLFTGILAGIVLYYTFSRLFHLKELAFLQEIIKNNIIHRK